MPQALLNLRLPGVVYRPLTTQSDASFALYCYHLRQPPRPALRVLLDTMAAMAAEPARR